MFSPTKKYCPVKSKVSFQNVVFFSNSPKKASKRIATSKSQSSLNLLGNLKTIGDYQIIDSLGEGAFAKVYLVQSKESYDKTYALKTMDRNFLKACGRQQEILIEKDFLINFKHPLITDLFRTFHSGNLLCLLLEYVPNKTLENMIENVSQIPFDVAMYYSVQILEFLSYLHNEINYVHRDLKPHNILIDENFKIKVIDFSSVILENHKYSLKERKYLKVSEGEHEEDLVGTCEYCAPEMYNESSQFTKSNDIWAFGCILYQLFGSGKTPFRGFNNEDTKGNILECDYQMHPRFNKDLQDLLSHIFVLDISKRYTVNDIINHKFFADYYKNNKAKDFDIKQYPQVCKYFREIASSNGVEVNEDKKIFTVTINEGIKWHDGTDFTVEDVIHTVELIKNNDTVYTKELSELALLVLI